MNEVLTLTLRKNHRHWRVDSYDERGLILDKEKSALPRAVKLTLATRGEATRTRIDWMLRRRGQNALVLKMDLEDGDLRVRGADGASLPEGFYSIRLDIEDLKCGTQQVDLADGEAKQVTVDVSEDRRQVVLGETLDEEIGRLLGLHDCVLDERELKDWLRSDEVRPRRKACLLNILTKLRCAPLVSAPLSQHILRIFFCDVDRVYAEVEPAMRGRVKALAEDPKRPFYAEGPPAHPAHRRLLAAIPNADGYTLDSYREEGRPSMQIVFAVPADPARSLFAEFDIDLGNPLQDALGLLVHIPEVVGSGRSDHLAMWARLKKGKTGAYLPYTVV